MNRQELETIALGIAKRDGLINLKLPSLCERAGIPVGSFTLRAGCTFTEFLEALRADHPQLKTGQGIAGTRTNPELRKTQILEGAIKHAQEVGFAKITREGAANQAGCAPTLINHHFGTMVKLRRAIMRAAINQELADIVAAGLAIGDSNALKAPKELKQKAAKILANI